MAGVNNSRRYAGLPGVVPLTVVARPTSGYHVSNSIWSAFGEWHNVVNSELNILSTAVSAGVGVLLKDLLPLSASKSASLWLVSPGSLACPLRPEVKLAFLGGVIPPGSCFRFISLSVACLFCKLVGVCPLGIYLIPSFHRFVIPKAVVAAPSPFHTFLDFACRAFAWGVHVDKRCSTTDPIPSPGSEALRWFRLMARYA